MTRTLRLLMLAAALTLGAGAAALAHGGHDHLMGTVKAVETKSGTVEVETREGKRVTVVVDDKTRYLRGKESATATDLVTGVRVVIDADTVEGRVLAKEIRLGPAPK